MGSDCEIAQYYKWAWHVARKEHPSCECSAPILMGEKYLQVNACWENRPDTYRQHVLCMKACEFIRDNFDEECVYYGGLHEWWESFVQNFWEGEKAERAKLWVMMLGIKRRERKNEIQKKASCHRSNAVF